jgi:hypothetical protein
VDAELAGAAACHALKVLCALAAGGEGRGAWLVDAGVLRLLRRLVAQQEGPFSAASFALSSSSSAAQHPQSGAAAQVHDAAAAAVPVAAAAGGDTAAALAVRRQASRLLAIVAETPEGAGAVAEGGWVGWLQGLATSADCKISSSSARALLHLESAAAGQRGGPGGGRFYAGCGPEPLLPVRAAAPPGEEDEAENEAGAGGAGAPPLDLDLDLPALGAAAEVALSGALARVRRGLDWARDAGRPPVPPARRLVVPDGVHLFSPLAPHHAALARRGTDDASEGAPRRRRRKKKLDTWRRRCGGERLAPAAQGFDAAPPSCALCCL